MFGWLFGNRVNDVQRTLASTDVEDADVLYAGVRYDEAQAGFVEAMEDRGMDVTDLRPSQVEEEDGELFVDGIHASELQDTVVFYREKSFDDGFEDGKEREKLEQVVRLDEQYGIEFVNTPRGAATCSDKLAAKERLEHASELDSEELMRFAEEKYDEGEQPDEEWMEFLEENGDRIDDLFDVPETYRDEVRAEGELDEEDTIVKKPRDGSLGNGIEFLELGEIDEFDDDHVYEEFVDHYSGEGDEEVVDSRIWVAGDEVLTVDREIDSERPEPTNISNGGTYSEDPMEAGLEEELLAYQVAEETGMDVFAIDLVRKQDEEGRKQLMPYEVNSTADTRLNDYEVCEADLYDATAGVVEQRLEEVSGPGEDIEIDADPASAARATP
jgi:glutathione synthase/RimK-type ligase-like ATP-grasp enzyme